MVSAAVSKLGKTPLYFVEPKAKVNAVYYQEKILRPMARDMNRISAGQNFIPVKVGLHARFFMRFGRDDLVAGGCRDKYRTCKQ